MIKLLNTILVIFAMILVGAIAGGFSIVFKTLWERFWQ